MKKAKMALQIARLTGQVRVHIHQIQDLQKDLDGLRDSMKEWRLIVDRPDKAWEPKPGEPVPPVPFTPGGVWKDHR